MAINNSVNPARTPIVACDCSRAAMDHNQLLSLLTCNDTLMECCKSFHSLATVQLLFPLFQLSSALSQYKPLRSELLFFSCLCGRMSPCPVCQSPDIKPVILVMRTTRGVLIKDLWTTSFSYLSTTTHPDWSNNQIIFKMGIYNYMSLLCVIMMGPQSCKLFMVASYHPTL